MKINIDTHTHSIVSGHAYSTISENIKKAKEIGLEAIGLTEHSINMPGSPVWIYFYGMHNLPKTIEGIRIYKGIELNIFDDEGNVDYKNETGRNFTENLDYAIASLHAPTCPPSQSKKINTKRIIGGMENEKVKIIGHLGDPQFPFYIDEVLKKALELNVAIELNNASLRPNHIRFNPDVVFEIINKLVENGNFITFGSDAHFHEDIGNFKNIFNILKDIEIDENKIVSSNMEKFEKFIFA